jgi:cytochrome c peroxidase
MVVLASILVVLATYLLVCDAFKFTSRCVSMSLQPRTSTVSFKHNLGKAAAPLAIAAFGAAQVVNARQSKLDFDQKEYENRPSATDAAPPVDRGIEPNWKTLKTEIAEYIKSKPEKGPTLVRLAWHSSGTYDRVSKTGGSGGGTIRFREELAHGANAGLDLAISWLEPFYKKYNKNADLSYGDLYTLAGAVAIETLGGPKIPWRAGRKDSFDVSDVTADGRLPDADKGNPMATAKGLRDVFYRMGFNDREIVALSGAHALGRCHATASGYVGPWSFTPLVFNNQYFVLLKGLQWKEAKLVQGKPAEKLQYEDPTGKLMMLPSDIVLIEDKDFKPFVDEYAKDNKLFMKDFAVVFARLLELGTSDLFEIKA